MSAEAVLKETLEGLGFPAERMVFNGQADTYFVFQCVISSPTAYSDDDNDAEESVFHIDLFTRRNYGETLRAAKRALKAAGFYGISVEAELYERDTGYYHAPITARFLEEGEQL